MHPQLRNAATYVIEASLFRSRADLLSSSLLWLPRLQNGRATNATNIEIIISMPRKTCFSWTMNENNKKAQARVVVPKTYWKGHGSRYAQMAQSPGKNLTTSRFEELFSSLVRRITQLKSFIVSLNCRDEPTHFPGTVKVLLLVPYEWCSHDRTLLASTWHKLSPWHKR